MIRIRRNILRAACLVGCAALTWCLPGSGPFAEAQPEKGKEEPKVEGYGFYLGAAQCSACHTRPVGAKDDFVKLREFRVWRLEDKHSQAYSVLKSPRGRRMGELLGVKDVTKPEVGCLGCHALDPDLTKKREKEAPIVEDGVSCEACHGPGGGWLNLHTIPAIWRKKSGEEKARYGLTNLRDPKVRAQVCLSCHQGNAAEGKVVTHAMYAVGHPPLPSVELAGFSEVLPPHWYHLKEVPWLQKGANEEERRLYDYDRAEYHQTRIALVGAAMSLRESAELLRQRSTPLPAFARVRWPELVGQDWLGGKAVAQNWPELAMTHFDCAACHHELERPSWRQARGYRGVPGRPLLPAWPRVLLPVVGRVVDSGKGGNVKTLEEALAELDRICSEAPFGKPGPLGAGAGKVMAACDKMLQAIDGLKLNRPVALRILRGLCDQIISGTPDYDSARMFTSAFASIYGDLPAPRPGGEELGKVLVDLQGSLNLSRDPLAGKREEFLKALVLSKADTGNNLEAALRDGDVNTKVNRALVTQPDLRKLSSINEESAKVVAERTAAYKPAAFLQKVRALRKALPRE
jgi:hypothetical protein